VFVGVHEGEYKFTEVVIKYLAAKPYGYSLGEVDHEKAVEQFCEEVEAAGCFSIQLSTISCLLLFMMGLYNNIYKSLI
jgi:hypothetical protein